LYTYDNVDFNKFTKTINTLHFIQDKVWLKHICKQSKTKIKCKRLTRHDLKKNHNNSKAW